jgi:glucose/arabinose dehydrogenase
MSSASSASGFSTDPHGLAFRNGKLFVAEEKQVNRYAWDEAALTATFEKKIADLPAGGAGHVTRSLLFDNDGRLFISVGSTCNVCNEKDQRNATLFVTNEEGENVRVFASGLRNAVFLTLHDVTNEVWVSENSRDLLGDDVPPDEINILSEGKNYGWPFCYGRQMVDSSFGGKDAAFCATTEPPVAELQAHSAALGLTFVDSQQFAGDWQGDLLVAFHGSWNRSTPTGYKVVRLRVDGKNIVDQSDFMTGFLQGNQAIGRPVDLEFDQNGSLYVSDDKAGVVYLITRTSL